MNNIHYVYLIEQFAREAPTMSVKVADEIARKLQDYFDDYYYNATCFALVADRVLGGGNKLTEMIENEKRPGVKVALKQALYLTGWVECGPSQGNPMDKLEEELARKSK